MNYHTIEQDRRAIQDDQGMATEYQEWINNPMTQKVIGILTVLGQPVDRANYESAALAFSHGHTTGWAACLNKMQMLNAKPANEVQADFGAGAMENENAR